MTSQAKHTALPWRTGNGIVYADDPRLGNDSKIADVAGWDLFVNPRTRAETSLEEIRDIRDANADLIVTAVNSHDALLAVYEAARELQEALDRRASVENISASAPPSYRISNAQHKLNAVLQAAALKLAGG